MSDRIAQLKWALAQNPAQEHLRAELAWAYEEAGEWLCARMEWEAYLVIAPHGSQAERAWDHWRQLQSRTVLPPPLQAEALRLRHGDGRVRFATLSNWLEGGPRPLLPLMRDALRDPHWGTRWAAATILGAMKDVPAVELLRDCLADPRSEVRAAAQEALAKIEEEKGKEKPLSGEW